MHFNGVRDRDGFHLNIFINICLYMNTHTRKNTQIAIFKSVNFPIMIKLGMRSIVTRPSQIINVNKCTSVSLQRNDDEWVKMWQKKRNR